MFSICLLAVAAVQAQNSDFSLLVGVSEHGQVSTGNGTNISGSAGVSFEMNYAWQLHQGVADLYIEIPAVFLVSDRGTLTGPTNFDNSNVDFFLTPGLRVKVSPQSRVSFYAAVGGGFGTLSIDQSTTGLGTFSASSGTTAAAALGFGGGVDFRLTRLLSLRAEGRDFLTRGNIPGDNESNHATFVVGIAFHF